MIPAPRGYKYPVVDLWVALLAGGQVWQAGSLKPSLRDRSIAGFGLVSLAMALIVEWSAFVSRVDAFAEGGLATQDRWLAGIGAASIFAVLALAIRPISLVRGRPGNPTNLLASAVWRLAAYLVLVVGTLSLVPRYRFLSVVPLGMVAGSDCMLTLRALGVAPATQRWLRIFLFSKVHFGVLGALLATALLDGQRATSADAFGAYIAMWVSVVAAGATIFCLERFNSFADAQIVSERHEAVAAEHQLRARWLHDDVLSEIRLAALRIDTQTPGAQSTRDELRDLDHRLRLRQLDEIVHTGRPHLYEIIQPHLRRAQSLGVELYQVPPLDIAERRVDACAGQLVNQAVSVLLSNAINADATRIGVTLREPGDPSLLELAVTDDAGGFDFAGVPPGGGLNTLMRDLAPGTVRRTDLPGGSIMTALIPISVSAGLQTQASDTP